MKHRGMASEDSGCGQRAKNQRRAPGAPGRTQDRCRALQVEAGGPCDSEREPSESEVTLGTAGTEGKRPEGVGTRSSVPSGLYCGLAVRKPCQPRTGPPETELATVQGQ